MNKKNKKPFNKINGQIRSKDVRLVGDNVDVGIYDISEAINLSNDLNLDLIEINPKANPPICKLMEYKKFLYEEKQRIKNQEKKNRENRVEVKEMRFGPNTDEHDFNFKKNHIEKFIKNGDKVKSYVFFKGREIQHKDKGEIMLLKLADDLSDICLVESLPKLQGNKMIMVLKPKK
jgi:translation initiation factor IF-3